jgi:hypothetical protein
METIQYLRPKHAIGIILITLVPIFADVTTFIQFFDFNFIGTSIISLLTSCFCGYFYHVRSLKALILIFMMPRGFLVGNMIVWFVNRFRIEFLTNIIPLFFKKEDSITSPKQIFAFVLALKLLTLKNKCANLASLRNQLLMKYNFKLCKKLFFMLLMQFVLSLVVVPLWFIFLVYLTISICLRNWFVLFLLVDTRSDYTFKKDMKLFDKMYEYCLRNDAIQDILKQNGKLQLTTFRTQTIITLFKDKLPTSLCKQISTYELTVNFDINLPRAKKTL